MMMDQVIQAGGLSGRQAAAPLGVTEEAVDAVLAAHAPTTRAGRPESGQLVHKALQAQHDFRGSYAALIRYLRRRRGQQPVRSLRRVETPPGMQAQQDGFEERVEIAGSVTPAFAAFARSCGFVVDPCRVRTPRDTGKVERRVRVVRESLAPLFRRS